MPRSNLTPQLRTRLSRQERLVGAFLVLAAVLVLVGAGLYLRQVAARKGWFLVRAPYFTFVEKATGIQMGDKVKLMGFDVGEVTQIEAMEPFAPWNVFIAFEVRKPYDGYIWSDSKARIAAGDLLGNRTLEVTKGGVNGLPTYLYHEVRDLAISNALAQPEPHNWKFGQTLQVEDSDAPLMKPFQTMTREVLRQVQSLGSNTVRVFNTEDLHADLTAIYDDKNGHYEPFTEDSKGFFLQPAEAPALTDRLDDLIVQVENALPHILSLTNEVRSLLRDATNVTRQSASFLTETRRLTTNLVAITDRIADPDGSLGRWLIPPELRRQATSTLASAQASLQSTDTNLTRVASELLRSLENLSLITSNFNAQVQANQFILGDVSELVQHTDALVQRLRQHWLLGGAAEVSPDETVPPDSLQPRLAPP